MEENIQSNDEINFGGSISLYEATCAKVNMMSNNKSKKTHNLEELIESCKITKRSAEYQQFDCDASMELIEVTSEKNGAKIIYATDDFYGVAENLLKNDKPVCNEQTIFDNTINKNVDGWKTQKMRKERHNFVIIQLAAATNIHSICIDTTCFIDHYSTQFSVQGGVMPKRSIGTKYKQNRENTLGKSSNIDEYIFMQNNTENWDYLICLHDLNPGYLSIRKRFFKVLPHNTVTHLRFNVFPDGGIARLRAYGKVVPVVTSMNKQINLISSLYNSHCISFSDSYIGHPNNIIQPNEATSITDGWATIRKYHKSYQFNETTLFDEIQTKSWASFKLGCSGIITRIVIDTRLFTGNAPYMIRVRGYFKKYDSNNKWKNIIPYVYVRPGTEQIIDVEKNRNSVATAVKIIIKPDGGISRFRVFGIPA